MDATTATATTPTVAPVAIYRAYRGVPVSNRDLLRRTHTVDEALGFRDLYEGANGFAIAVYETSEPGSGIEVLRYQTDMDASTGKGLSDDFDECPVCNTLSAPIGGGACVTCPKDDQ